MRVTNKMMNNNSMLNINKNKEYLDKLNNQMASKKKINRPSDDPVIAIRALKLRSNVTELTQYHDKNTNDAKAWLEATQDAVESTSNIMTEMKGLFVKGATGTNSVESRNAILESLKASRDQIYDNGNSDYAGRTVFTGYRTNTKLTFQESDDLSIRYENITERFTAKDLEDITYISGRMDATDINRATNTAYDENTVKSNSLTRIRLAYDTLDEVFPATISVYNSDGSVKMFTDENGHYKPLTIEVVTRKSSDNEDYAYNDTSLGRREATFIPETGEIILSDSAKSVMENLGEGEYAQITYSKDTWKPGDLRPEHYFDCYTVDETKATGVSKPSPKPVEPNRSSFATKDEYEEAYLSYRSDKSLYDLRVENYISYRKEQGIDYADHNQDIKYDISTSQSIQINTYASDVYKHSIGRDIDDMIACIEEVSAADDKVNKLKDKLASIETSASDEEKENVQKCIDAANKEFDLLSAKMQKMFEEGVDKFNQHVTDTTLEATKIGTRLSRLDLVQNRLLDLKTTATTLASDNENIKIEEVAIDISEAELCYNAALMATGQISQQTLLSYI